MSNSVTRITREEVLELEKQYPGSIDYCEHASEDTDLIEVSFKETDSFGIVGVYVTCQECHDQSEEEEEEEVEELYLDDDMSSDLPAYDEDVCSACGDPECDHFCDSEDE